MKKSGDPRPLLPIAITADTYTQLFADLDRTATTRRPTSSTSTAAERKPHDLRKTTANARRQRERRPASIRCHHLMVVRFRSLLVGRQGLEP